jgi:tol-pal system protein YbgF
MMHKLDRTYAKTRLLLIAGALFAVAVVTPASAGFAQDAVSNRIQQLENQIQTLSRAVYRGEKLPPGAMPTGDASGAAIANFEVRLSDIENQQRGLTGQIEQLTNDVQQLKTRIEKMSVDYEMRFQQQSGGGAVASTIAMAEPQRGISAGDMTQPVTTSGTLGSMTSSGGDNATLLYENAFADIRDAKYDSAETKFKQFMSLYANHSLAANAQYWLAETHYVRGDYRQSAKMFAQGYQDYPQGPKAPDSLLKLGLSLAKLGKKEDACLSFAQLKKQFPGEQTAVMSRANQEIKQIGCN